MSKTWLDETAVSLDNVASGLSVLYFRGIDDGDIFIQRERSESWALSEGKVKHADYSASSGLGVRAICGEKTGFAYADGLGSASLDDACRAARAIVRHGLDCGVSVTPRLLAVNACFNDIDPLDGLAAD